MMPLGSLIATVSNNELGASLGDTELFLANPGNLRYYCLRLFRLYRVTIWPRSTRRSRFGGEQNIMTSDL